MICLPLYCDKFVLISLGFPLTSNNDEISLKLGTYYYFYEDGKTNFLNNTLK